jgi:hypothetical protein
MGQRLQLQTLLESFGVKVYFQPPANVEMEYPCIVYSREAADTKFAGHHPYRYTKRYSVIHISRDPDSDVPDQLAMLPLCTFSRHYVVDKLNHDAFSIYF